MQTSDLTRYQQQVCDAANARRGLHDALLFMRSGNGPAFVSQAILEWISGSVIATVLNNLGKPWQKVLRRVLAESSRPCLAAGTPQRVLPCQPMVPYSLAIVGSVLKATGRRVRILI